MPVAKTPLINGREYDWASISLLVGGVLVYGITRINYADNEVKEDHNGAGPYPVSRGYGNKTASCSITLYASETEAIQARAPGKRLNEAGVFDVTVQYLVGAVLTTHVIRNCEFKGNQRNINQGDTKIEVEHELITSHIDWGK